MVTLWRSSIRLELNRSEAVDGRESVGERKGFNVVEHAGWRPSACDNASRLLAARPPEGDPRWFDRERAISCIDRLARGTRACGERSG